MPPTPLVRGVVPQFREEEGEAQRHLEDQGGEAGPTHELHDRKDSTVPTDTTADKGKTKRRKGLALQRLSSRDRTRTCDPLINSQLLYQLSYSGRDASHRTNRSASQPAVNLN